MVYHDPLKMISIRRPHKKITPFHACDPHLKLYLLKIHTFIIIEILHILCRFNSPDCNIDDWWIMRACQKYFQIRRRSGKWVCMCDTQWTLDLKATIATTTTAKQGIRTCTNKYIPLADHESSLLHRNNMTMRVHYTLVLLKCNTFILFAIFNSRNTGYIFMQHATQEHYPVLTWPQGCLSAGSWQQHLQHVL